MKYTFTIGKTKWPIPISYCLLDSYVIKIIVVINNNNNV